MSSNLFSRKQSKKQRIPGSHPATSDDQPLAHGTTLVSDISTHGDITMSAIQTFARSSQGGECLGNQAPIYRTHRGSPASSAHHAGLKQYKEECEIVMHKLARIARIIVGVGELELDRIERVLKKCSKRRGIKGVLLRKDLLTKIKQCDVEISNVLQAFHAELSLDTRVALIAMRRETAPDFGTGDPIP
ncbi:hypothetical protein EDB89DRAFT_2193136 [Lactarius sanguifluus]|nr:hypothetical protein EDB89DRAFT_2193136 [Lactarius sanguifluus]